MQDLLELDRDSPEYLRHWIITSWPGTAAQAWESYLKAGRGLLLVDLANGEPIADFNLGLRARCEYVPVEQVEEHATLALLTEADRTALMELLSVYEPEREVVYCFTRRKGGALLCKARDGSGRDEHAPPVMLKRRGEKPKPLPELRGRAFGQG